MCIRAVFIDKDGTLVKNVPYNVDPSLIGLEKSVLEGLQLLDKHGYKKIIISNQPGVAMGYYSEDSLKGVNAAIQALLAPHHISIDAFYYCPHYIGGNIEEYAIQCNCRKPLPGLIQAAAKDWEIDIETSWMLGDILHDIEAGNAAGCSTVLIDNGGETEWVLTEGRLPDYMVPDFLQAAKIICNE